MRRRTFVPLVVAAMMAGAWVPPAGAGGGWWSSIYLDAPYLGSGETVTVTSELLFDSAAAARRARSSSAYYVYLLPPVDEKMLRRAMSVGDPGDWWTPPSGGRPVGRVRFAGIDANLADVAARVVVPYADPGKYSLMMCDAGCAHPLANVVPLDVRLSPDAAMAAQVRRLTARKWQLMHAAALARRRLDRSRDRVGTLTESLEVETREAEGLERRAADLEERADDLSAELSRERSGGAGPPVAAALAAGFVTGGLAGFSLRRRRVRSLAAPSAATAEARR